jgi:hypothetical protein
MAAETSTRHRTSGVAALAAPLEVHEIRGSAVYSVEEAQRALHLRRSTIRREVREGRLRVSRRAGRYFILGQWLVEWIEGGEISRRRGGAA